MCSSKTKQSALSVPAQPWRSGKVLGSIFRNLHPLSKNRDFSTTKHLVDMEQVWKLEFVHCSPVEKKTEHAICLGLITQFDKVRGCICLKNNCCRFSRKLPNFRGGGMVVSPATAVYLLNKIPRVN